MPKKIYIISFIVLLLDQVSKILCDLFMGLNESILILKNFFYLTYVHNDGAAWSMMSNQRFLLIGFGVFALFILYKYVKDFKLNKRNILAFGLLFGGILGNLLDRLFLGFVRDFLDFKIFGYDYPVFNISDITIFVGVILLIVAIIKGEDYGSSSIKRRKSR